MTCKRIVVTAGEPAGVGPDLVLALANSESNHQLVVCADKQMLAERAKHLGIDVDLSTTMLMLSLNHTPKAH